MNILNNKRVGIVMTYYNRQYQLNKTIESINKQNCDNVFVVIVDDNSDEKITLPECNFNVDVIRINGDEKKWTNPEPAYNRGFLHLINNYDCNIIINQNAECYHVGDVIEYARNNTKIDNYLTFGCFSISNKNTFNSGVDISSVIGNNNRTVNSDDDNGWYNHPLHRPSGFEFCSSIHKENLISLNGYDERFGLGYAVGDADLLRRIKLMKLKVEIIESPFVVHQWHDRNYRYSSPNYGTLRNNNTLLYDKLVNDSSIKGAHLFNDDLK